MNRQTMLLRRIATTAVLAVPGVVVPGVAVPAPAAAAPVGTRVDLRVLVLTDGGPATAAIADQLTAEGVPQHTIDLTDPGRPTIDAGFLAEVGTEPGGADRARYQAVVVPSAGALTDPAEATALADYERRYGVRRVESYVWPNPAVGLSHPDYSGPLDGAAGLLTPAGLAGPFGYLRGPVPFEDITPAVAESWGHLAQPLPADPVTGAEFTPLLTGTAPDGQTTGTLLGQYTADGRERLITTFSHNAGQRQFRLLAPGIVAWATRGVRLGHQRNYLSVHVDDVLPPTGRTTATSPST